LFVFKMKLFIVETNSYMSEAIIKKVF